MVVVIGKTGCNAKSLLGKVLICFATQSHASRLGWVAGSGWWINFT